ncbi:MAG: hypothetical protein LBS33_02385 [Streptococcaceae bacterium]|jgi:hypothetical protein|nr:hypothetical protein [Streptococcaceae bacterium]
MGKFQLDDKGRTQVERYHEKHSRVKSDKQLQIAKLRQQFLEKRKNEKSKATGVEK